MDLALSNGLIKRFMLEIIFKIKKADTENIFGMITFIMKEIGLIQNSMEKELFVITKRLLKLISDMERSLKF